VDGLWIHSAWEVAVAHLLARLVAAQDVWARPLGDFNHRWISALFRPIRPIKDFLNGTWIGHPLHAAATDIPIGTLLLTVVLDIAGQTAAADIALVLTILFMLAAAVTGAADYADTDGSARVRATVHSTIMVIGLVLLLISLGLRFAGGTDRTIAVALSLIGFLVVTGGAFVGGDVVYIFGNMVSRHAFRGAGTKWIRLDTGDVTDLATLPEATPTKAKAGINDLVLVRVGETVHAVHAVCSHAGGPLAQGTFADGCIECPWHGSRFRMSDGRLRRGPALYDQPAYEIRAAEGGGYEVRRQG
jgi:nitrite reductase/ring-hydroxylating ferredoxin subunit